VAQKTHEGAHRNKRLRTHRLKKKPRIYNKNIDMGQKCYLKGYDLPASTIALPPLQIGKKIRGTKLWGPKKHTKVCT
jgi:hypothetical protein